MDFINPAIIIPAFIILAVGAGFFNAFRRRRKLALMSVVKSGVEYPNNYHVLGVGYYHAASQRWHPHPWNEYREDRGYYWDGNWNLAPDQRMVPKSTPSNTEVERVNQEWRKADPDSARRFWAAVEHDGFGTAIRRLMKRIQLVPRADWQSLVEKQGLVWHSEGEKETWNERAAYLLSPAEVQKLCQAGRELAQIYHQAAGDIVKNKLWSLLGIREHEAQIIKASWERGEWSLHGRFDFLFDVQGCPKLLEYNAETALSLVESAVVQKHWLAESMPGYEQFNNLEECLLQAWRESGFEHVHCVWRPRHAEVEGTVRYMARLLRQAGIRVTMMALHRMGWDSQQRSFVDHDGTPIQHCYKLYPWEWMLREPFAKFVESSQCSFIEPPWRLLLGSKGILCVISELFGDHPSVVECHTTPQKLGSSYVSKPMFGHEGHNVTIHRDGMATESLSGEYGDEAKVFQAFVESPRSEGYLPQFGVWMVRDQPAAICIRETLGSIISAHSAFVPHAIER